MVGETLTQEGVYNVNEQMILCMTDSWLENEDSDAGSKRIQ